MREREGGSSTYRFVCALAQSIFFELSLNFTEVTKRTHTTPKQPAQAKRAGYAEAVVCGSRTLELPQNADSRAPRSP